MLGSSASVVAHNVSHNVSSVFVDASEECFDIMTFTAAYLEICLERPTYYYDGFNSGIIANSLIHGKPYHGERSITELSNDPISPRIQSVSNLNRMKPARTIELGPFARITGVGVFCRAW